jgi:acetyl-CoA carboxylase carboxyltransferase component
MLKNLCAMDMAVKMGATAIGLNDSGGAMHSRRRSLGGGYADIFIETRRKWRDSANIILWAPVQVERFILPRTDLP